MFFTSRVVGNSGMLKSVVLGPAEPTKIGYLVGLLGAGALLHSLLPGCFEVPLPPSSSRVFGAFCVGMGVTLANGCTSGHGLCGLSRLSLRSLVAVPTFMACAAATIIASSGTQFGGMAPVVDAPEASLRIAAGLALALGLALLPALALGPKPRLTYLGLWSGACFGTGLCIGGMVRPSAISGAFTPTLFDPTLWVLFMTALAVTFTFYRLAELGGVEAARVPNAGTVDTRLVAGAALFGLGWGLTGSCPGPHIVTIGATPMASGPLAGMGGVFAGILAAGPVATAIFPDAQPVQEKKPSAQKQNSH